MSQKLINCRGWLDWVGDGHREALTIFLEPLVWILHVKARLALAFCLRRILAVTPLVALVTFCWISFASDSVLVEIIGRRNPFMIRAIGFTVQVAKYFRNWGCFMDLFSS
jgi:uncharacterized integral membrane protein